MMDQNRFYMTPEGFKKIKKEYTELLYTERPKIVETVKWAASNGDRSENADYIYGKKRLREIDSRLKFLSNRMEKSFVVDPQKVNTGTVVFGVKVTIENEEGEVFTYQLVGEDETDIRMGKISWKSPVAKSLLGKKIEDEVVLPRPKGSEAVIILKIESP